MHDIIFFFVYRVSNLHLIHWENILLDFTDVTNIRTDTAKGAAAKKLSGRRKFGLVLAANSSEFLSEKSYISHIDPLEDSSKFKNSSKTEDSSKMEDSRSEERRVGKECSS